MAARSGKRQSRSAAVSRAESPLSRAYAGLLNVIASPGVGDGRTDGSRPNRGCSCSDGWFSSGALGSLSRLLLGRGGRGDTAPLRGAGRGSGLSPCALRASPRLLFVPREATGTQSVPSENAAPRR